MERKRPASSIHTKSVTLHYKYGDGEKERELGREGRREGGREGFYNFLTSVKHSITRENVTVL